ncbi:MAG: hypothetical protein AB1486_28090, partial [Planctomycetota bacterium]
MFIHDTGFNVKANHGFGEWARSRLIIREGQFREEVHVVHIHREQLLNIMGTFDVAPRDGDSWRLVRPEYFEPDPDHPIDPEIYGPFDPGNPNNSKLEDFVTFTEIDATGRLYDANGDGRTDYRADELLPSRSIVTLRFDEGMDPDSLAPYESLRVTPLQYRWFLGSFAGQWFLGPSCSGERSEQVGCCSGGPPVLAE